MNAMHAVRETAAAPVPALLEAVPDLVGDAPAALAWAAKVGRAAPKPGAGDTAGLWRLLADVAALDVGVARVLEPHLDALAILDQAGIAPEELGAGAASTWGVYAAESAGTVLRARREGGRWLLDGEKPWCSLAREVSHALVTARLDDGTRGLFAVELRVPGVTSHSGPWVARGLSWIVSAPVAFDGVRAAPVGLPGWYLERPGFAWGGLGVAACWYGGAVGVARALLRGEPPRSRDPLTLAHLGAVDTALHGASAALTSAAELVDDPAVPASSLPLLAARTRSVVVRAAEEVLSRTGHALGPAPLVLDADHARRVADLELYLRQHHAERDDAALGAMIRDGGGEPW